MTWPPSRARLPAAGWPGARRGRRAAGTEAARARARTHAPGRRAAAGAGRSASLPPPPGTRALGGLGRLAPDRQVPPCETRPPPPAPAPVPGAALSAVTSPIRLQQSQPAARPTPRRAGREGRRRGGGGRQPGREALSASRAARAGLARSPARPSEAQARSPRRGRRPAGAGGGARERPGGGMPEAAPGAARGPVLLGRKERGRGLARSLRARRPLLLRCRTALEPPARIQLRRGDCGGGRRIWSSSLILLVN